MHPGKEELFPEYESDCALCPGNQRQNGEVNPQYTNTYSFRNDKPVFYPFDPGSEILAQSTAEDVFSQEREERGLCEVVCYCPQHNRSMMHFHFTTPMLTPDRVKYHAAYGEDFGWQRDFTPERAAETLRNTITRLP